MSYLGLSSLVDRRITANLRVLDKQIDGFIDSPELFVLINFKISKLNARHTYPFSVPTNYGSNKPILISYNDGYC